MIRVALLVLLGGCFSRPELARNDGSMGSDGSGDGGACTPSQPGGKGLVLTEDTDSHEVTAYFPNGKSITFADPGTRYPFPVAINIYSEQLVATPGPMCGREDLVGIAAFPIYSIGGAQTPTNPNIHPLDTPVVGPANIQLVSHWTYQHATECTVGQFIHGNGQTTWSLSPDGRIVRYDYLQPADNGDFQTNNACTCIQNIPSFTVTSFMAIAEGMVDALTAGNDSEGTTPIPGVGPDIQDARSACFRTPMGSRLALYWDNSSQMRHDSRIRHFDNEIVFVNDIVPGNGPGADAMLSNTDNYTLRTQMFLENDSAIECRTLMNKLQSHAQTPAVEVDGALTAADGLGFYDDTITNRNHTSMATLVAENGRIEAGWTLRIRFNGYRSITTSMPTVWQHEHHDAPAEDIFYIHFPDGLPNNGSVMITPECPN